MTDDYALRERIRALEIQMEHLTTVVESQDKKLTILVETFQQARGARIVLFALVGIGGFLAGKLPALATWLGMAKG